MNEPSSKRKRLSYACNYCREKKKRCDEQQPSCRNCQLAGVECITTDKRRGGVVSYRRRSTAPSEVQIQTPLSQSQPSPIPPASVAQCWDRAGWRSGRLPMMPRLTGGRMFDIMTEWLDLAFYRLRIPAPYSGHTVHSSSSVPQGPPVLPSDMRRCGQQFLDSVCRIFPFMDESDVYRICDLDDRKPSEQALACLIASATTKEGIPSYINHCSTLLGHIIAERTLQSVQAIFLFSIVLRSRDEMAWAWDILSLGVSMAQSIGIHQHRQSATWWCMYVFEKILAFESGRTSVVYDRALSSQQLDSPPEWKTACLSMANMLHELQDRAAGTWRREEWLPQTVEEAIEEKITTGGELATRLDEWWKGLPDEYKAGMSPQAAFLSFYYRYALILLNRSVFLIEPSELAEKMQRYAVGKPWEHHITNGMVICVDAAREMIKLSISTVDAGQTCLTTLSPLIAVYALAVHILRERRSLLVRVDLELMKAGIALIKENYQQLDGSQRVNEVLSALEDYTVEAMNEQVAEPFNGNVMESPDLAQLSCLSTLDWAGWDWNDLHLFE
ncbi:hypothetical protein BDV18DRAFT_160124 [Aspergillus unguis]